MLHRASIFYIVELNWICFLSFHIWDYTLQQAGPGLDLVTPVDLKKKEKKKYPHLASACFQITQRIKKFPLWSADLKLFSKNS